MANARISPPDRAVALKAVRVAARVGGRTRGWLTAGTVLIPVALGRSGIRPDKREGDGATPSGGFHPLRVWWRADRGLRPRTLLPTRRIGPADAWCDDPSDRRYNRPIRLANGQAGDRLWRTDHLYDLIIELDHNVRPRIAGRGSAIFVHVARPGLQPTGGCVALPAASLRRLLARIGQKTRIRIH
jgi:L,D-peptidoglycan transpeptidase YkuD (ErfK/YbiS/YcfS/YnhG family)